MSTSSFSEKLVSILEAIDGIEVDNVSLMRDRLLKMQEQYYADLKRSSGMVSVRGRKMAINRFNKDEKL